MVHLGIITEGREQIAMVTMKPTNQRGGATCAKCHIHNCDPVDTVVPFSDPLVTIRFGEIIPTTTLPSLCGAQLCSL